tara:strand:- start:448 stop:705 length:258 start_codon:yes stop_codon:yes gene_type:complete
MENAVNLTETQENKARALAESAFEQKVTEDVWQFSLLETRLNLDNMKFKIVFEVHSSKGSFLGTMDLNDKKQGLKSSLKFELQNN